MAQQYFQVNPEHTEILDGPRSLPTTFRWGDFEILGFDGVDDPEAYDWFPLVNVEPEGYDPLSHNLKVTYVISGETVLPNYEFVEKTTEDVALLVQAFQADKQRKIADKYAEVISVGMPHNFGTTEAPLWETLQCRNELDRTNWLGLKDMCRDAIALGAGDTLIPSALRCTSNRMYQITFSAAKQLMTDIMMWAAWHQAVSWELKDAVDAATSVAQVNAVDETAWPQPQ